MIKPLSGEERRSLLSSILDDLDLIENSIAEYRMDEETALESLEDATDKLDGLRAEVERELRKEKA